MKTDIVAAAEWAVELGNYEIGEKALTETVNRWYRINSLELSEWIPTIKSSESRDVATVELVEKLRKDRRPQEAYEWAQTIADDPLRELALGELAASIQRNK
ncbi:MAG: hypothetical protein ACI9R3_005461 [Verrucomicrobiales bacterium]